MGVCSDYLSIGNWRERAKDKFDPSEAIPRKSRVRLQFLPTNPRNKVAKYFAGNLNAIKKVQRKDVQHEN